MEVAGDGVEYGIGLEYGWGSVEVGDEAGTEIVGVCLRRCVVFNESWAGVRHPRFLGMVTGIGVLGVRRIGGRVLGVRRIGGGVLGVRRIGGGLRGVRRIGQWVG